MTAFRLPRAAAPLGLAAALALALGLTAVAQTPPVGGSPVGAPGPFRPDGQMREHRREAMETRRAERIADWTTVLKLTPAQAQALQTAMTRPRRDERARGDHKPGGGAPGARNETTLQRLDRMQARVGERDEQVRQRLSAMRAFYTSLSPDQQKSFDALTRLTHGGMHGRRHGRWGGEGGMGGLGVRGPGMRHGPPPPPGE